MTSVQIVLVSYNAEKYVAQALQSISLQRFPSDIKVKVVIADDCSTDITMDIIREWANTPSWKVEYLESTRNLGITKNYRRIFESCNSDYLAVLEADDYWVSPDYVYRAVSFLDSHREASMYVGNYIPFVDSNTFPKFFKSAKRELSAPRYYNMDEMLEVNYVGNLSSCVFRGETLKKVDGRMWNVNVTNVDDWLIGIEMCKFGFVACVPEVSTMYRLNPDSFWSSKPEDEKMAEIHKRYHLYHEYIGGKYYEKCLNDEQVQYRLDHWSPFRMALSKIPRKIFLFFYGISCLFVSKKTIKRIKQVLKQVGNN